jgi:hypothetical protein
MLFSFPILLFPLLIFDFVDYKWLLFVLFGLLVVAFLSVLAGAGNLLFACRP